MRASYLGVIMNFFDFVDKEVKHVLLGIYPMSGRHTAANIKKLTEEVGFL